MANRFVDKRTVYIIIAVVVALICSVALFLLLREPSENHGVSMPDVSRSIEVSDIISADQPSRSESTDISFDYSLPFYEYSDDMSEASLPEEISVEPETSLPAESSRPADTSVPEHSTLPEESEFPEESENDTSIPETSEQDSSLPDESVPDISEPEVSESEVSEPEVSAPEVSEPEVSEPEVSVPEVSEPEVSEPETSVPDETSKPSTPTAKPDVEFPTIQVPEVTTSVWNGSSDNNFESGKGTKNDPYIIKTAAQLAFFRDSVNSGNKYEGKYIKLAASIKLNSGDLNKQNLSGKFNFWVGIGSTKNPFYGTFDGDGYVVSGVYGDALFNTVCGSVLNLGVTNSYINFCGGIVGTASKDYKSNAATVISNCYIVNSIVNGGGGVVDYAGGYDVSDCYNGAHINAVGDWVGGVIGQLAFGTATNCYNVGTVDGDTICGGVVGNSMRGTIKNCYNAGSVNSTFFAGAFAGTQQSSTFTNCGYLSGTADYIYQTYSGEAVSSEKGIKEYTKNQIEY